MVNIIAITHAYELFTCWSALEKLCTMSGCLRQRNRTYFPKGILWLCGCISNFTKKFRCYKPHAFVHQAVNNKSIVITLTLISNIKSERKISWLFGVNISKSYLCVFRSVRMYAMNVLLSGMEDELATVKYKDPSPLFWNYAKWISRHKGINKSSFVKCYLQTNTNGIGDLLFR